MDKVKCKTNTITRESESHSPIRSNRGRMCGNLIGEIYATISVTQSARLAENENISVRARIDKITHSNVSFVMGVRWLCVCPFCMLS